MRPLSLILAILFALAASAFAQQKAAKPKAADKMTFTAKTGNVVFDHAAHVKLEKDKCDTCHPKLFPESRAPINFKAAMHKTAETNKTSCAGCHVAGGSAFASKGNCNRCHVKADAKKG